MKLKKEKKETVKNAQEAAGDFTVKRNKTLNHIAQAVCLITAIIIWFYAVNVNSPIYTREMTQIPIQILNTSVLESEKNLSVISGYGYYADIIIRGRQAEINKLKISDLTAYVDVSAVTEAGKHTLPVKIETPNGVTLEGTYPESITVYLDTRTSVQVPVDVKLSNYTIPNDCVIESSAMVPNITVSGPDEELAKIKTARISLEPGVLNGSVTISGKPVLLDEAGNEVSNPYIKMTPTDVEVRLELQTYKEIPINVSYKYGYYNSSNASVTISPPTIRVRGTVEQLAELNELTVAQIDETTIERDGDTLAVISLPDGVTNVSGYDTATISIRHIGTTLKTIPITHFTIINAPTDKTVEVITASLDVRLRGPRGEYFTYLGADDIEVVVDMQNVSLMTGRQQVSVEVRVANYSDAIIYPVGSYSVILQIE